MDFNWPSDFRQKCIRIPIRANMAERSRSIMPFLCLNCCNLTAFDIVFNVRNILGYLARLSIADPWVLEKTIVRVVTLYRHASHLCQVT